MAVTPLVYNDIVDIRWNPFANGGQGEWEPKLIGYGANPAETRQVPNTSPFQIKLYEMPQLNAPSTTDITLEVGGTQLQEISIADTPGNLEYRVVYPDALGAGLVQFNSAQAGQNVVIRYYGLGHIIQKISLDTRVPSTGDTTIAGDKTLTGNNTHSGENYFSDQTSMGISSADSTYRLHVRNTSNDAILTESRTSVTGSTRYPLILKHETTGNMTLDFGVGMRFIIEDSAAVENIIATIFARREAAADDEGELTFSVNTGAGLTFALTINHDLESFFWGKVVATSAGVQTRYRTANTGGAPTDAELDAAFGTPATLGNGYIGVFFDTGGGGLAYFCCVANGSWYYTGLTLAV